MACFDLCQETLMPKFKRYEPNRLQINKKRYYVLSDFPNVPEGLVLPSVTTIASATSPPGKIAALMNWRKKVGDEEANRRTRNAVDRGNWLHGLLEDLWNDEDIETHLDSHPHFVPYFHSVSPFLETVESPLLVESAIAWFNNADQIGFSGTFDMLARMANGKVALLDWKTSYKLKSDSQLADYRMQLAAYSMALEQMYDVAIEEAHCVISIYDPDKGEGEEAQVISLDPMELAMQETIMIGKTNQFFQQHYPGRMPLIISLDKGS